MLRRVQSATCLPTHRQVALVIALTITAILLASLAWATAYTFWGFN